MDASQRRGSGEAGDFSKALTTSKGHLGLKFCIGAAMAGEEAQLEEVLLLHLTHGSVTLKRKRR